MKSNFEVEVEEAPLPRVSDGQRVVVDLQAALYEVGASDPSNGLRVPRVTFEAESAMGRVTAISGEDGKVRFSDLLLAEVVDEYPERTGATVAVTLTAHRTCETGAIAISKVVSLNIEEPLDEIYEAMRARQEAEAEARETAQRKRAAEEAESERRRIERERYERLEPDRKRQIKADITKAGEDIRRRERLQVSPFNVLRQYEEHPHAEKTAVDVANEASDRTIESADVFKSARWAGRVMAIAAGKCPLLAVQKIGLYVDASWALGVLKVASARHPHAVLQAFPEYAACDWRADLVLHIAETAPQAAFEEVQMWEYQPWAEKAARVAAEKAPEFTRKNYPLYETQAWAKAVYASVQPSGASTGAQIAEEQRLLKKEISEIQPNLLMASPDLALFARLYEHRHHPQARAVMLAVAEKAPQTCIKGVAQFKSARWAKEMMLLAANKAPLYAIQLLPDYIELDWAHNVVGVAARLEPGAVLVALRIYADQPWAKDVVAGIGMMSGATFFQRMEYIEFQPWAKEVVIRAALLWTKEALAHRSGFADQSWAPEVTNAIEDQRRLEEKRAAKRLEDERAAKQSAAESARKRIEQEAQPRPRPEPAGARAADETRRTEAAARDEKQRREAAAREEKQRREADEKTWKRIHNAALVLVGLILFLVIGYHAYGWVRAPDYEELLRAQGVDLDTIADNPSEVLPEDIHTLFTPALLHAFSPLVTVDIFQKRTNGTYVNEFPVEITRQINQSVQATIRGSGVIRLSAAVVADGLVTMNLRRTPIRHSEVYTTGIIFKDYHGGGTYEDSTNAVDVADWLTLKAQGAGTGAFQFSATLKATPDRPIAESIGISFSSLPKAKQAPEATHTATIQRSYWTTYKSRVLHDPKEQAALREKRRQRLAQKTLATQ